MSLKSDESIFRELREEIQRRCKKRFASKKREKKRAEEVDEEKEYIPEEAEEIFEEDELLDDILAEKRRKYSAKDEFVYLLYNDMLANIIADWSGRLIKKKRSNTRYNKHSGKFEYKPDEETSNESIADDKLTENDDKNVEKGFPWRLALGDEFVDVTFVNKNSYTGRVSRKMMEGDGIYKWHDGTIYKGEFEQNRMQGRGLIHWINGFWYEGDFNSNSPHGEGTMANAQFNCLYKGSWAMGQKHGRGFCRRGGDSYEGGWVANKMDGEGRRIYENGGQYVGQFENGARHGSGTMVWPNGDVFRGEWKNGKMHGYGEYTWRGFFNKTLTWPREAFYAGDWHRGMRHGKGLLKLNSPGGAKYFGCWKQNKKDGYGLVIGNNGQVVERDPLFIMDNVVSLENRLIKSKKPRNTNISTKKPSNNVLFLPVGNPEYCPDLSYYTSRLLEHNGTLIDAELEERWVYNCIRMHISRLREVYDTYAKVFTDNPPPCALAMSHMALWQLWRDCEVYKKGLGLAETDNYLAQNKSTFIKSAQSPFEKFEFWQFIHALLEVSWHFYAKFDVTQPERMKGKLASGLEKFFEENVFPNAGNHIGKVYRECRDILPMRAVYKLYQEIGRPVTAKKFLRATCLANDKTDPKPSSSLYSQSSTAPYLFNGINCVTVGEKLSYIPKNGETEIPQQLMEFDIIHGHELLAFRDLGAKKIVEIMSSICPLIKDTQNNLIVNIDYEITYLEFYEIILEAGKQLLEKSQGNH